MESKRRSCFHHTSRCSCASLVINKAGGCAVMRRRRVEEAMPAEGNEEHLDVVGEEGGHLRREEVRKVGRKARG